MENKKIRKRNWWLYLIGAVVIIVHIIPIYILVGGGSQIFHGYQFQMDHARLY